MQTIVRDHLSCDSRTIIVLGARLLSLHVPTPISSRDGSLTFTIPFVFHRRFRRRRRRRRGRGLFLPTNFRPSLKGKGSAGIPCTFAVFGSLENRCSLPRCFFLNRIPFDDHDIQRSFSFLVAQDNLLAGKNRSYESASCQGRKFDGRVCRQRGLDSSRYLLTDSNQSDRAKHLGRCLRGPL